LANTPTLSNVEHHC